MIIVMEISRETGAKLIGSDLSLPILTKIARELEATAGIIDSTDAGWGDDIDSDDVVRHLARMFMPGGLPDLERLKDMRRLMLLSTRRYGDMINQIHEGKLEP